MMVSANGFRSIGWIALLLVCGALVMVLAFRVNALRSQVHRTELKIIALRKEKLYLETEVETRANQQQLKLWNDVEFGYVAPSASQYLSSERQLAAFAKPDGPDMVSPIRVASADDSVAAEAAFPSMIAGLASAADLAAPLTAAEEDKPVASPVDRAAATANLGTRLAMVSPVGSNSHDKAAKAKDSKPGLAKAGKATKDDGSRVGKSKGEGEGKVTGLAATGKPASKPGKATAKTEKAAKSAKSAAKGSKSAP